MNLPAYLKQVAVSFWLIRKTRPAFSIRPLAAEDRPWLARFLEERWGAAEIVTQEQVHPLADLSGFAAIAGRGLPDVPAGAPPGGVVGVATYSVYEDQCELVSLDSLVEGRGIGSALVGAVRQAAVERGCRRLWLITTNDNTPALRFYQRGGFRLATVFPGAVDRARLLKPGIPLLGVDGIPIHDEIKLEMLLDGEP